ALVVSADRVDNSGTITLNNGTLTLTAADPGTATGLVNAGAISLVDSTLNAASGVVNSGAIDALRSTVFVDATRLSSTGKFELVDSTLRVGGEFVLSDLHPISRTNSAVAVAGTLLNQGATLDLGALPDALTLDGGRILGGSVLAYDAALSVSSHHGNALDG